MSQELSPLELEVMQVIWDRGSCSAEEVRQALAETRPLKDSTVRTLLRRMEEKGFVSHRAEGRTYIYEAVLPPRKAAAQAVRPILDRLCGGSLEALLVGLVDDRVIDPEELRELADKIAREDREGRLP